MSAPRSSEIRGMIVLHGRCAEARRAEQSHRSLWNCEAGILRRRGETVFRGADGPFEVPRNPVGFSEKVLEILPGRFLSALQLRAHLSRQQDVSGEQQPHFLPGLLRAAGDRAKNAEKSRQ